MLKNEIFQKLKNFGFTELDAEVFLVILEKQLSATLIAKLTNKPKTNVYNALDKLIKENFVVIHLGERGREFKANPGQFQLYAQHKIDEADEMQREAGALVIDLGNLAKEANTKSQFKAYFGLDGIKQVQWNVLRAKTEIYYYTSADRRKLFGDKWIKRYWDEFVRRDLREKGFESVNNSHIEPEKYFSLSPGYLERSLYKFVEGLNSKGEVYIYNDVYSMYTWENNELVGIEINNKALVETQRSIFEKLWS